MEKPKELQNLLESDATSTEIPNPANKQSFITVLTTGLVNMFTYSDYFFCSFILKGLLSHYSTILVASSTAYLSAYFTMFVFSPGSAITSSLVTFASQMAGENNYEGVKRVFYQSILIQIAFFTLLNIIGVLLLDPFLSVIGATELQA